mmetsp:Transcript_41678/g.106658  ORF Transcript_41678/g.106658 Transcript_41678/m.106658 type:complete len:255 (+) Transcript_41678:1031-1795(+)
MQDFRGGGDSGLGGAPAASQPRGAALPAPPRPLHRACQRRGRHGDAGGGALRAGGARGPARRERGGLGADAGGRWAEGSRQPRQRLPADEPPRQHEGHCERAVRVLADPGAHPAKGGRLLPAAGGQAGEPGSRRGGAGGQRRQPARAHRPVRPPVCGVPHVGRPAAAPGRGVRAGRVLGLRAAGLDRLHAVAALPEGARQEVRDVADQPRAVPVGGRRDAAGAAGCAAAQRRGRRALAAWLARRPPRARGARRL